VYQVRVTAYPASQGAATLCRMGADEEPMRRRWSASRNAFPREAGRDYNEHPRLARQGVA